MAVIIRKPGQPKMTKENQHVCKDCGCIFTFRETDLKSGYDPRDNSSWSTIDCPQEGCGAICYPPEYNK